MLRGLLHPRVPKGDSTHVTTPTTPSTPPSNQNQPPPAAAPAHLSPDGKWRWDGSQWVANAPLPSGPPPPVVASAPPAKKRGGFAKGCLFSVLGVFALIVIIVVVAIAIPKGGSSGGGGSNPPPGNGGGAAQAASCTQPCAVANNVTITVSSVQYAADGGFLTPEAGNVFVTMNVDAINKGDGEANLNPFDFVLKDAGGIKHTVTWTESCGAFSAINLTKGADSGPKCIAFQAKANAPAPLTLVWTPTIFGGGDHDIKLA